MLDMGFLPDLKRILAELPEERQNLLFSATMPRSIRSLANQMLRKPHVVELAPSAPSERIEHFLYPVREDAKSDLLDHVLAQPDCKTAIVFMRTKHRAKRAAEQLSKRGRRAVALQGNMSQGQRDRAMEGFRKGRFDVLVATDIAARGLDVAGVDYVVNFDVPTTPDAYTHRIGRTGRSEASGKACHVRHSERSGLAEGDGTHAGRGDSAARHAGGDAPRRRRQGRRDATATLAQAPRPPGREAGRTPPTREAPPSSRDPRGRASRARAAPESPSRSREAPNPRRKRPARRRR